MRLYGPRCCCRVACVHTRTNRIRSRRVHGLLRMIPSLWASIYQIWLAATGPSALRQHCIKQTYCFTMSRMLNRTRRARNKRSHRHVTVLLARCLACFKRELRDHVVAHCSFASCERMSTLCIVFAGAGASAEHLSYVRTTSATPYILAKFAIQRTCSYSTKTSCVDKTCSIQVSQSRDLEDVYVENSVAKNKSCSITLEKVCHTQHSIALALALGQTLAQLQISHQPWLTT